MESIRMEEFIKDDSFGRKFEGCGRYGWLYIKFIFFVIE